LITIGGGPRVRCTVSIPKASVRLVALVNAAPDFQGIVPINVRSRLAALIAYRGLSLEVGAFGKAGAEKLFCFLRSSRVRNEFDP
jgi:hypothetical protein